MRRIFSAFLVCILIIGAVGCSKEPAREQNPSPQETELGTGTGSLSVTEKEAMLHPGEWALPGTLTLPAGEGPFPLVIFVHGSGPADRNETMGKTTLFADLARELAQQGIASLRYDKRTYLYASKMAADTEMTVWEETVEDVLFAVAYGKDAAQIDADNIFVAAHSFGGYLIPRIDQADTKGEIAGYISLAGAARPLMDLMVEQVQYILSVTPELTEAEKTAQLQQIQDARDAVAGLTEADSGSNQAIMGAYPSYWLDLGDYRPTEEVKGVEEPLLFLQGGHDYQVTTADYALWQAALEGKDNAAFQLYPDLTHAFTQTDAMSTPGDYEIYAKVDPAVAEDIGAFIQAQLR